MYRLGLCNVFVCYVVRVILLIQWFCDCCVQKIVVVPHLIVEDSLGYTSLNVVMRSSILHVMFSSLEL